MRGNCVVRARQCQRSTRSTRSTTIRDDLRSEGFVPLRCDERSDPKLAKFWERQHVGARHAPSAAERARVAEILAPDVALYRDAQRLWQTYKDAFGGGNATAPEGAAGRRAGRRAERRAAQQMLRQRRRVVSG
jgi:hypothetical protein